MQGRRGRGINNLIHYLLCKAHQHCYTMATIELLIAFLCYPPGENAHAPPCSLSLPAPPGSGERRSDGKRGRDEEEEECRLSSSKVKLQCSNLIKSIRVFPVRGQPPCCAHSLILSIMWYSLLVLVNDRCSAN